MGEVYGAHDSRLGRDVAIKVLPTHLAKDPQALARFDREARAVTALSHPNILVLYDVGSHEDIAYTVTPRWVKRTKLWRSLTRRTRKAPVSYWT